MKLTLAIVCSLLLAGTPLVLAQAPAACVVRSAHTACHCGKACCAKPAAPASAPSSTIPAAPQNQILAPAPAAVVWLLPAAPASEIASDFSAPLTANRTPLFARNCAFLI
jgi:hypothetical protein